MNKKYVPYKRVSTQRQGASGLGLESQDGAISAFVQVNRGNVVAEFTEVESGRKNDRPELAKALATCRQHKATLVIVKLDRLARSVSFISNLMDSGVDFVALDMPDANRFMLHVMAAMAEHEARLISDRTKAALAVAKRRGTKLGNPQNLRDKDRHRGTESNAAATVAHNEKVRPTATTLRERGYSLAQIAAELSAKGLLTRRGNNYCPKTVARLLSA
jgi:DNA invertase Pin-like site-specific DNA recombinase